MRKPIAGICRFCGCTEASPCLRLRPELGLVPVGTAELPAYGCSWVDGDQDLCSSAACVLRAYQAAVARTEAA
jgi:hypothetical protein